MWRTYNNLAYGILLSRFARQRCQIALDRALARFQLDRQTAPFTFERGAVSGQRGTLALQRLRLRLQWLLNDDDAQVRA